VVKVEWHAGELFPRVGFIVTNLKWDSKRVVRFYNRRGTAEQWIKEGKNAVKWTKLSCRRFQDNAARLQLFALAYNLAYFLRQLVLGKSIQGWTLTTLREKLVKIGAKVVTHSRYLIFQLTEVAVTAPVSRKRSLARTSDGGDAVGGGQGAVLQIREGDGLHPGFRRVAPLTNVCTPASAAVSVAHGQYGHPVRAAEVDPRRLPARKASARAGPGR
jgi:hypothetical protein